MFAYIKGTLTKSTPMAATIEAHGVGYYILIPASTFSHLPATGSEVMLHTNLVVRENSHTLFGFLAEDERDLFDVLTGVSGVGPKLALSLIGHLPLPDLQHAVNLQDVAGISKVPGIGKKTAQRLLIELRDKLTVFDSIPEVGKQSAGHSRNPEQQKIVDAMNALINLGYNQQAAKKAIKRCLDDKGADVDLAELITESLKCV